MTIGERIGFVTLATTDSYAAGALVLARSLRQVNTVAELVCLVEPLFSFYFLINLPPRSAILSVKELEPDSPPNSMMLSLLMFSTPTTMLCSRF